jgi:hypothetical protein
VCDALARRELPVAMLFLDFFLAAAPAETLLEFL